VTTTITTISASVTLLVLCAGLLHAAWNAIAKSITDQFASFTLLNLGVAVPCLIAWPLVGLPNSLALRYLVASVGCHIVYEIFLMSAYRHGALSRSYPIARGVAPFLTTIGGYVFARESLSVLALLGVGLVVVGIISLALHDRAATSRRAIGWALATGVAIAGYTLIDGLGVRASDHALQYTVTLFAVQGTLWILGAIPQRARVFALNARQITRGLMGGVVSLLAYGAVLFAQTRAPLGVVSALRETGVLWATAFGVVLFKERGGWRLAVAAAVVLAGICCIAVA
jgi:drug/metabolite transporter (DMT)-like permease